MLAIFTITIQKETLLLRMCKFLMQNKNSNVIILRANHEFVQVFFFFFVIIHGK